MIIKYPTGFYRSQLKTFVQETNITYNISNNPPLRSAIVFQKIPDGVAALKRATVPQIRRDVVGELVYTSSNGSSVSIDNGQRVKQIGEVLEFSDTLDILEPKNTPESQLLISHDLFYTDYNIIGLDDAEVGTIDAEVQSQLRIKSDLVNNLKTSHASIVAEISSKNKLLNDVNRTIQGLTLLQQSEAIVDILRKLNDQLLTLTGEIENLNSVASSTLEQITVESNNLRAIGALAK
jgi:hypothetical protein